MKLSLDSVQIAFILCPAKSVFCRTYFLRVMRKIIIDDKIPYIKGVLESFAQVLYLSGADIVREVIDEFKPDALIVRTRTRCNRELLEGSSVRFIASATIGFDHIDLGFCRESGVEVVTAAGCNAGGVVNYILTTFAALDIEPSHLVGIVGVGNVGSLLCERLRYYGFRCMLCDPPRARAGESGEAFESLEMLQRECDVITIHTPLNREGEDRTLNLINDKFIEGCKRGVTLINSSRGEVVDQSALIAGVDLGTISKAVIDVWQDEPNISGELLSKVAIATAHLAGYSSHGKYNGTRSVVNDYGRYAGVKELEMWMPCGDIGREFFEGDWQSAKEALLMNYDVVGESRELKNDVSKFEYFRDNYNYRRELI